AHACLLLLNRQTGCYPGLRSVLVYPSTFLVHREETDKAGLVSEHRHELLGESWGTGLVVLAWDEVRRGVADFTDGHNVVLHEFAHQLDHEDGTDNGAPLLAKRSAYQSWAIVLAEEFAALQRQAGQRERGVLDPYGATNPAEFFAVATETFFERPAEMQIQHRKLYDELRSFYRVNPVDWL
ncbi:MAG: M90 family metallopeptidase, partial [Pseudohongiellaceae bacterium]